METHVSEDTHTINIINMCGFDSGLGKELNNSIISAFPSCLEIKLENENMVLNGVKSSRGGVFRQKLDSDLLLYSKGKDNSGRKLLLNQMYFQMLVSQKQVLKLEINKCQFLLIGEENKKIHFGIELLFIHSLVFVKRKPRKQGLKGVNNFDKSQQGEFAFVINFDKEFVYLLSPFEFQENENYFFEISKSPNLCLDLDQQFMSMLNPHYPQQILKGKLILPFKGLKLSKRISTKLRKKISKRKNIS